MSWKVNRMRLVSVQIPRERMKMPGAQRMRGLSWTLVTCALLPLVAEGGEDGAHRGPDAVSTRPAVFWTDVHSHISSPDHPLLLLLADIAAERDVPIDLHMDIVSKAMPLPEHLRMPANPERLQPNLDAFERLLAHNRKARIIWSHAGWDNTGQRTIELMSRLLTDHANLYMSIKRSPADSLSASMPVEQGNGIRSEWLVFLQKHGDRILMGCDQFFVPPGGKWIGPESLEPTSRFFSELPVELQKKLGVETLARVFGKEKP